MSLWSRQGRPATWNFRRTALHFFARPPGEWLRGSATGILLLAGMAIAIGGYLRWAHRRIAYRVVAATQVTARARLHGGSELALLEKLNRADRPHLVRLRAIVVPDRWRSDELAFSPLPRTYPWAKDKPKLIVVQQPAQVFGAYERGRLVRWGPISTGTQQHPTPQGLFHLTWRSRAHRSSLDRRWQLAWYFNFEERRGLAFHQDELPGWPSSHGCVRLLKRDAAWLYRWGQPRSRSAGTPVLIIGHYDFGNPPPWRSVLSSTDKVALPEPSFNLALR